MARHIFDVHRTETRELVANQLRSLADELAAGELDLAYEQDHEPTCVVEPVDVVVDLRQGRHRVDLVIHLSWPTEDAAPGSS